ncbi:hypothetical protein, partial [Fischerella thermalis]|uniref:hypothetical protein n=1 Tax=Fischerella thermalis TaxID=372787 RepID=UPI001CA498F5
IFSTNKFGGFKPFGQKAEDKKGVHLSVLPSAGPPQIRDSESEFVENPFCPLPFFGDTNKLPET